MTNFDLTDEEKLALAAELKRTIAEDRYPLSPRVRILRSILDKLDPRAGPRSRAAAEALRAAVEG